MNDKDLIEFFIYLRDHCYNRDFSIEPKKVVECFYEYREQGYKLPIHDVSGLLKAEREATKEEIREWLKGEDFEGLAERL
jgi:hypothetical protein